MQKNKIVFLIRSYNESTRILQVIEGIFGAGFDQILVVDDGSIDNTREILFGLIEDAKIHFIHHATNRGAGAALETGFQYIRDMYQANHWKYVVTFDADGQHDIQDMDHFMDRFKKDDTLDIVFGSRFIKKTNSNVPFLRRLILLGGRIFTSLVSGVHLTDAHNGYRMLKVETLDKIHITMDGMEYASELIDQIGLNNFRFTEVPVNIHYDDYTMSKGQRYGGVLRIVARILMKKYF